MEKKMKKGEGLGGRKPLSVLSNTAKPFANQASRKNISMNFGYINEEIGAAKSTYSVCGKKSTLKARIGGRRPLGDISNSGKPSVLQASEKKHNNNLNAVVEEQLHDCDFSEEHFLHNHEECIKAKRKAIDMDIDCFLKTIGLNNDSSMQLASPLAIPISA